MKALQFKLIVVSLGCVESWRGSAGDEALGEIKVDLEDREQDEDGRRFG